MFRGNRKSSLACILASLLFIVIPIGSCEDGASTVDEIDDRTELISCMGNACSTRKEVDNNTGVPTSTLLSEDGVYNFASTEKQTRDFEDLHCSTSQSCSSFPADCIFCKYNYTCVYGQTLNITCVATSRCKGPREFVKQMTCQYCYQSKAEDIDCNPIGYCNSPANPMQRYKSNCTVKPNVLCLGQRKFYKNVPCNWTSGYKWSTAIVLSITLGGFGADRFYLGYWQEGIGKLFSFGGAGVWTLIDVILVAVGYLKPADGSLYI